MKFARTNTSPLGEPGFEYNQQLWGDHIRGTKEQLQRIGIAVGMAFPGETDGPKRQLKTTDHRGFPVTITESNYYGEGIFSALIPLPGRREPDHFDPWTDCAPGVKKKTISRRDEYVGTAAALNNAGLVRLDQLPGQPGMRKTRVTILPDGTPQNGRTSNCSEAREPGAKKIERASKNTYMISIVVPLDEEQRRDNEYQRKRNEWENRMRSLPRPAPLIALPNDARSCTAPRKAAPKYRADGNVLYLLPRVEGRAAP